MELFYIAFFTYNSFQCEPLASRAAAGVPRGYWSFSWLAEDDLSFPSDFVPVSDHRCPGSSRPCDRRLEGIPEFTWSIVAAGDLREERNDKLEKKAGSPHGWEEGTRQSNMADSVTQSRSKYEEANKLQRFNVSCF
ncbi:hypothetical protein EYF80_019869 [Liparis tanakae]|uniref:Uncharacterized protein n=1 Tax=Liparis tanakae TaxID=230148 RepID=A0A4Z2HVW8_9TELE|nr:hypothetical protein EYF80_019869 [Liparis tanakae]